MVLKVLLSGVYKCVVCLCGNHAVFTWYYNFVWLDQREKYTLFPIKYSGSVLGQIE